RSGRRRRCGPGRPSGRRARPRRGAWPRGRTGAARTSASGSGRRVPWRGCGPGRPRRPSRCRRTGARPGGECSARVAWGPPLPGAAVEEGGNFLPGGVARPLEIGTGPATAVKQSFVRTAETLGELGRPARDGREGRAGQPVAGPVVQGHGTQRFVEI